MDSDVSAAKTHAPVRIHAGSRISSATRHVVTVMATCSDAKAATVCTARVSHAPARTATRSSSSISWTRVLKVGSSRAKSSGAE